MNDRCYIIRPVPEADRSPDGHPAWEITGWARTRESALRRRRDDGYYVYARNRAHAAREAKSLYGIDVEYRTHWRVKESRRTGYSLRRQSKRWLDGDCPRGVLAIYDDKHETDRYTIFYAEVFYAGARPLYANAYIIYAGLSEYGRGYHGEMETFKVADFRYRNAHRACKWTDLPEAVRNWIRADLEQTP